MSKARAHDALQREYDDLLTQLKAEKVEHGNCKAQMRILQKRVLDAEARTSGNKAGLSSKATEHVDAFVSKLKDKAHR